MYISGQVAAITLWEENENVWLQREGGNLKECEVMETCYFIKKEVNALNAAENSSKTRIEKYSLVCYV